MKILILSLLLLTSGLVVNGQDKIENGDKKLFSLEGIRDCQGNTRAFNLIGSVVNFNFDWARRLKNILNCS